MKIFSLVLLTLLLFSGCIETADPALEEKAFVRVYNDAAFSAEYAPIDMQQTDDGGYLILGSKRLPDTNFSGIYLLKVDAQGRVVNEVDDFDTQYVNPVGKLTSLNGGYYFFCMSAGNQEAQLVLVSSSASVTSITPVGYTYPAAAAADGNELLLLNYDNANKVMQLSRINTTGATVQGPNNFSIGVGDETEEPIINHFLQAGKKFPFSVGRVPGGNLYFNGFYNYSFSMVFATAAPDTEPTGVVYGIQDDGGFSAIEPLSANAFAVARFNFGDNYVLPNVAIASNSITINTDLDGFSIPELVANAPVKIIKLTQPNSIVYASNTESGQIALYGYNTTSSALSGTKYLGFSNPYEVGSILQTRDGGLAICGVTYVAGRFPRLCLFKLSAEDVSSLAGQ